MKKIILLSLLIYSCICFGQKTDRIINNTIKPDTSVVGKLRATIEIKAPIVKINNDTAETKANVRSGLAGKLATNGSAASLTNFPSSATTYPGTGIANSAGSSWGTSFTTSGSGTVIPLQTSPTFITGITSQKIIGGTTTTDSLTLLPTSGNAASGSTIVLRTGNNGSLRSAVFDGVTGQLNLTGAFVGATSGCLVLRNTNAYASPYTQYSFVVMPSSGSTPIMTFRNDGSMNIAGTQGSINCTQVAATNCIVDRTNVNTGIYFTTANTLIFKTNSNEVGRLSSTGMFGLGTASPTNILSLSGQVAQKIWMERNTTANTAATGLTIASGGVTVSATNKGGLGLVLQPDITTGTRGKTKIELDRQSSGAASTSDNTMMHHFTIPSSKILVNNTNDTLYSVVINSDSIYQAVISLGVTCNTGTGNTQSSSNLYKIAASIRTGAIAGGKFEALALPTLDLGITTLAETLALSYINSTKTLYIIGKWNSSLSPTGSQMRAIFTILEQSGTSLTITQY
jgi:hypothetical protein